MNVDDIKTVAVLGAGDMGHGIAEVALMAGYKVYLRDIKQEFIDRGAKRIVDSLDKLVSKGKVDAGLFEKIKSELMVPCLDLAEAVATADLIIEAVPEIMDLKKETFKAVDEAAPAHAIIASNTSTMSITEIASVTCRPEKAVGLHYFNPAVLMKTVEVIRTDNTSDETMQVAFDFATRCGKVAVRVEKDVPGFIVNRVQAPTATLLLAILENGEIEPEAVDATLRKVGMPMGPYETMDYTGLDVNFHASSYFAEAIHPDFTPTPTLAAKVKANELGKKTGKGIFDWSAGRPQIDLKKATAKLDPMDLIAVQVNEATKIIAQGACSIEDVDKAITNGTGAIMGPMMMVKGQKPEDLAARLDKLAEKYDKEIFRPTQMIKDGEYK
jgi:enoyl-CoA hydratase / 3-hydroxyacyl-CoA dehydrogenase